MDESKKLENEIDVDAQVEEEGEENEEIEKIRGKAREQFEQMGDEGLSKKGSYISLLIDANAELDMKQKDLLKRVRKSVHIAKTGAPNLRLAAEEDAFGMKMVDMSSLLNLIQEESIKMEVQKEAAKSKKMVENISKLLSSEGFL